MEYRLAFGGGDDGGGSVRKRDACTVRIDLRGKWNRINTYPSFRYIVVVLIVSVISIFDRLTD